MINIRNVAILCSLLTILATPALVNAQGQGNITPSTAGGTKQLGDGAFDVWSGGASIGSLTVSSNGQSADFDPEPGNDHTRSFWQWEAVGEQGDDGEGHYDQHPGDNRLTVNPTGNPDVCSFEMTDEDGDVILSGTLH